MAPMLPRSCDIGPEGGRICANAVMRMGNRPDVAARQTGENCDDSLERRLFEPFAGLDPIAVHTLAEVLRGEAARGAAALFSSHQLELVEDICEDVAIIDHGHVVATGDVEALRRASHQRRIELQLEGAPPCWLPDVRGVQPLERHNGDLRLLARRDVDPEEVLTQAERAGTVVAFTYGPPSLAEL
jgi:ABC-2 type transport system ATP-binding protein